MDILALIQSLADKYPLIVSVLAAIGFLRLVNKPVFAILRVLVVSTESKKDDAILDDVEESKIYKAATFVIDWLGSVKLPSKK